MFKRAQPCFLRETLGQLLQDGQRANVRALDRLDGFEQPLLLSQLGGKALHALDLGVQRTDRLGEPVSVAVLLVALADEDAQTEAAR